MTQVLPAAFTGLLALFALNLLARSFGAALLPGITATALLALVLASATGTGRLLLKAFGAREMSESEKTLIGATLGLGALSQAVFLLGMAGFLRPWTASLLLALMWVAGFTELRELARSLGANKNLLFDRPVSSLAVLIPLAAAYFAAFAPPHQYDSLVYHLPIPAAYAREGRIFPVEHLVYTHFPQNGEMLYTLALLLGSDVLAQLFTWLCALLSVWWLLEMGKREAPMSAVLLACGLVATHSAMLLLASTTYVECVLMLWITAAVFSFLRWREARSRGWLALSGVFAGLGVGTKYYAGITPALLALHLLLRWAASLRRAPAGGDTQPLSETPREGLECFRDLALFSGAAAAAGSPWLIKNALTVGNPVFPFFYRWLPARGVEWTAGMAGRYFDMLVEYRHRGDPFGELARFLWQAASGSPRYGGGADILGSVGWGPLLALMPLALWSASRNRYMRALLAYCAGHFLLWFSTAMVLRFLVPVLPLAALPAACGLQALWAGRGALGRAALASAGAVLVAVNLGFFLHVHSLVGTLPVLTGAQGRREYLAAKLDYYPCARFAAERLPQNDRILVVGEQRGYYVMQPHTATTVMAPNRFVLRANEAEDPGELLRTLGQDYRHILFVPREAKRLGEGYGIFAFTPRGAANWSALLAASETEFEETGRCALLKLPR
ncbi:MAG: phospholipid carrier-dependent glycosyltransferase [Elusimicrobiota bacterium]